MTLLQLGARTHTAVQGTARDTQVGSYGSLKAIVNSKPIHYSSKAPPEPGKPKRVVWVNWECLEEAPVLGIFNLHLRWSFSGIPVEVGGLSQSGRCSKPPLLKLRHSAVASRSEVSQGAVTIGHRCRSSETQWRRSFGRQQGFWKTIRHLKRGKQETIQAMYSKHGTLLTLTEEVVER